MTLLACALGAAIVPREGTAQVPPAPTVGRSTPTDSVQPRRRFRIPFLHHRHRAKRARNAQVDSTTPLQFEYGYDSDFDAPGLVNDLSTTLSVVITPNARALLQVDYDTWVAQRTRAQETTAGHGDLHLTLQWTAGSDARRGIASAVAYEVKIPTASPRLGTDRVDHRLFFPFTLTRSRFALDLSAGIDANRLADAMAWGGEGAVSVTVPFGARVAWNVGVFGQSVDTDKPAGTYLSGGLSWQVTSRVAADVGARAGLGPGTTVYGVTAGMSFAGITR